MKRLINIIFGFSILIFCLIGCDGSILGSETVDDPNNPSVEQVVQNATEGEIQNLITGLEIRNRQYVDFLIPILGTFGRELWQFDSLNELYVSAWIGTDGNAETDPDFFVDEDTYETPYSAISQANLLLDAVDNTDQLSEMEKSAVRGFAKTLKGFQFLIPLQTQYQNGIRVDVSDPQNLGPFLSYDDALTEIRGMLDEGYQDLQNGGEEFFFNLSEGLSNFSNPSTMSQLNRAIAARAAIYAKDWQGALDVLEDARPFFELASGEDIMNKGAYLSYGNPPDVNNPLYRIRNAQPVNLIVVHPTVLEDTLTGDLRIDRKFFKRDIPVTIDALNDPVDAEYQDNRYEGVNAPISMLRNEELILIYAEAHTQIGESTNIEEAVNAVNYIRNTWNLPNYLGPITKEDLVDEILVQRRYSLWAEFGHRWIDMRRYERLDEIGKLEGEIFQQMARPQSEINFEDF